MPLYFVWIENLKWIVVKPENRFIIISKISISFNVEWSIPNSLQIIPGEKGNGNANSNAKTIGGDLYYRFNTVLEWLSAKIGHRYIWDTYLNLIRYWSYSHLNTKISWRLQWQCIRYKRATSTFEYKIPKSTFTLTSWN